MRQVPIHCQNCGTTPGKGRWMNPDRRHEYRDTVVRLIGENGSHVDKMILNAGVFCTAYCLVEWLTKYPEIKGE